MKNKTATECWDILRGELDIGMTSEFFKLLTLLFLQFQCEELRETIQENFT